MEKARKWIFVRALAQSSQEKKIGQCKSIDGGISIFQRLISTLRSMGRRRSLTNCQACLVGLEWPQIFVVRIEAPVRSTLRAVTIAWSFARDGVVQNAAVAPSQMVDDLTLLRAMAMHSLPESLSSLTYAWRIVPSLSSQCIAEQTPYVRHPRRCQKDLYTTLGFSGRTTVWFLLIKVDTRLANSFIACRSERVVLLPWYGTCSEVSSKVSCFRSRDGWWVGSRRTVGCLLIFGNAWTEVEITHRERSGDTLSFFARNVSSC